MTMLTGLEPCAHGVLDRHGVLDPQIVTLAEVLRASGYRTAAFTENGYVVAGAGFARGFDTYAEHLSEESASPGFASETFGAAERWLASVGSRAFFLFVHTYQVHGPYTPPRGYQTLFDDDFQGNHHPEYAVQYDNYDREIRYIDDALAGFLDALAAARLAERTVVVVTSDHGESFGEHYFTRHSQSAFDEEILVPPVIRAPGLIQPGLVVEGPVGLADLVPTLLELVGVEAPADIQGQSFASLLRGEVDDLQPRPLVLNSVTSQAVRIGSYKYHRHVHGKWEVLYDLSEDPRERVDLAAREPERVAEARRALDAHRSACERWRTAHPRSEAAGERWDRQPGWMINRDEIDRKLRSLGYLE